jgi:hypothetical protein
MLTALCDGTSSAGRALLAWRLIGNANRTAERGAALTVTGAATAACFSDAARASVVDASAAFAAAVAAAADVAAVDVAAAAFVTAGTFAACAPIARHNKENKVNAFKAAALCALAPMAGDRLQWWPSVGRPRRWLGGR